MSQNILDACRREIMRWSCCESRTGAPGSNSRACAEEGEDCTTRSACEIGLNACPRPTPTPTHPPTPTPTPTPTHHQHTYMASEGLVLFEEGDNVLEQALALGDHRPEPVDGLARVQRDGDVPCGLSRMFAGVCVCIMRDSMPCGPSMCGAKPLISIPSKRGLQKPLGKPHIKLRSLRGGAQTEA